MTYLYIILGALAIISFGIFVANNAQADFMSKYKENLNHRLDSGDTTQDFLQYIFKNPIFDNVEISYTDKELADHYSNVRNEVTLSKQTLTSSNVASFAIIAHEFGHAEQNYTNDKLYNASQRMRKLSKLVGVASFPCIIVGLIIALIFTPYALVGYSILGIGAICFCILATSSILLTIVEFNATKRGLIMLKNSKMLSQSELKKAKEFLYNAGYTYLGNFCSLLFSWTFLVPKYKIV